MRLNPKEIGERIRDVRKIKGYSQKGLAKKLNISQSALCAYETGRVTISLDTIPTIAKALDVSEDRILGLENFGEQKAKKYKVKRLTTMAPQESILTQHEVTWLERHAERLRKIYNGEYVRFSDAELTQVAKVLDTIIAGGKADE